ncbi:protein of unknown function [Lachnospiraceae bacterium KHCPX20]|nr:protein of unknown function [Lachnospiraceae bacterium KHCPX20]
MKRLSMVFAAACMATTLATAVPMNVFAVEATQEAKPEEVKESSQTEDTSATQELSVTYKTKKYVKKVNIKMGNKTVKKTAVKSTFLYPVIANTDPAAKKIQAYFQKEYKNWKKANQELSAKDWKVQYLSTKKSERKYCGYYTDTVSYDLTYNTDEFMVSFRKEEYTFTGGAHGSNIVTGATFSRGVGRKADYPISCLEGYYTEDDFKQMIYKGFAKIFDENKKAYGTSGFFAQTKKELKKDVYKEYDLKIGKDKKPFAFKDCFYIRGNKDGSVSMIIIANQYDLAPYAAGVLEAEVLL